MVPTTEKKKRVYVPPSWIDLEFIKTLSKDKQKYWANRIQGNPGQGIIKKQEKVVATPQGIGMSFNNAGEMVIRTREMRRQKPTFDNQYTKKKRIPKRKK